MPNPLVKYIFLIILMALVTYLPRFLPLFLLARRKLPALLESWLSYVPVAVLAALLGPALFMPGGKLTLQPTLNPFFWAAIPSFLIAFLTRNMFLTVLVGMGSVAALRYFF
jgi:branched-subunit amino acid transport protein